MEALSKDSSLLFATFSPYVNGRRDPKNGNVEPFIDFFPKRIKRFVLIDQPHAGSDIIAPIVEEYSRDKKRKYVISNFFYDIFYFMLKNLRLTDDDTNPLFKVRDFISVVHVGFSSKGKFNYFIGLESINALAGLFLKIFGKVDCVVYYVSDYSPLRYKNKLFNSLYLVLDRFCCYHSDFIWDVSLAMQPARIKAGLDEKKSAPVIHVPNALFPKYIKHLPYEKIKNNSIVFMGSLGFENGPDLAIKAMPEILNKFPDATLDIIGGGKELLDLKEIAIGVKLLKNIKFHGMIKRDEDMLSQLRQFHIGLAPYKKIKGSVRLYGDSLKLRAYMASGIPVITTQVPPLGRELAEYGSVFIAPDSAEGIARAVIKLLSDRAEYIKLREKAISYGKNNIWDNSLISAFEKMKQ